MLDEKRREMADRAISEEELLNVVGGAQTVEIARCAGCGRGCAAAAMYALGSKKYCPACYRKALKG